MRAGWNKGAASQTELKKSERREMSSGGDMESVQELKRRREKNWTE